jgi:response regulator of citrate/malate metabolism
MLILHLEDSATCRAMLAAQIAYYATAAELVQFSTVQEARAALVSINPDAAILDVHLADGYGAELLPHLSCPVEFVTSSPKDVPPGRAFVSKRSAWIPAAFAALKVLS